MTKEQKEEAAAAAAADGNSAATTFKKATADYLAEHAAVEGEGHEAHEDANACGRGTTGTTRWEIGSALRRGVVARAGRRASRIKRGPKWRT